MASDMRPKRRFFAEFSRDHMIEVAQNLKVTSVQDLDYIQGSPVQTPKTERICDRELTSLYALLAYVAHNQNVRQETAQMILEARFNVDHIAKIRRSDYTQAVEFLIDMKLDEMIN